MAEVEDVQATAWMARQFSTSLVLAERQFYQSFSSYNAAYIHQKGTNSRILLAQEELWQAEEAWMKWNA